MEPLIKPKVSKEFMESIHGQTACVDCHGGRPSALTKEEAHRDMDRYPSLNNPEAACGGCHENIAAQASHSLHATLAPYLRTLKTRSDTAKWDKIYQGYERHCAYCHTGCGGCHVSRPQASLDGLLNGHMFQKRPDSINQCTACHGSRVGNEFFGKRGQGDIHAAKYNMDCVSCHQHSEMHAAASTDITSRYQAIGALQCVDCHKDLAYGSVKDHEIHLGKVQCQVCHAQTYTNCYNCHTGIDSAGLPYYKNQKDEENLKIGLAYEKDDANPDYDYMLVRHIPTNPNLFDFYVKDAFKNFDRLPTWKRTSPHNIQRKTWQNANCNNCHGNRELFLSEKDLLDYEIAANKKIIVPSNRVPKRLDKVGKLEIDAGNVMPERIVSARWLRSNLDRDDLVVIDAREAAEYEKGHIPGAVSLDPMRVENGIRYPWQAKNPAQLIAAEELSRILGDTGISEKDHIIVYDQEGWRAGYLLFVLEYAGATDFSFLEGGIQGWRELTYPLSCSQSKRHAKTFNINPKPHIIVGNRYVMENLDNAGVVVVDTRSLDLSNGLAMHEKAIRPGRIPGSIKFPWYALYESAVRFKTPEKLLYRLKISGIPPDKTIVVTSKTGGWAGAAFFALRYLGYPDVRVHHASWVGWCAQYCSIEQE